MRHVRMECEMNARVVYKTRRRAHTRKLYFDVGPFSCGMSVAQCFGMRAIF
jgi:hypothetical protein